jgi:DNA (cytosine-5)-methyltransferase 1
MRFVDLFAGLGGFHLALRRLGHECVFACETDPALAALYQRNFGLRPKGDIRRVRNADIPPHDILCAGFPCQPFSKAGDQKGTACPKSGGLFNSVLRVLQHHLPEFAILENVPNLGKHNNGRTWVRMRRGLVKSGYAVEEQILSPHHCCPR